MLKTTFSPTPLVSDLEFEGHAVGMWKRNLAPERFMWLPYDEKKIMIVRQTLWSDDDVDTVHV